jgi:SAM-dependent methyltransferase
MNAKAYGAFARFYDVWQSGFSLPFSEAVLPFYEREILQRGVPERSLLDLACGTGTFLLAWGRKHPDWRRIGVDGSPAMLRVARRKLGAAPARSAGRAPVPLLCQPMESVRAPAPVGAIVCVFDSVNHLTREPQLVGLARAAARSLRPQGLFLFDLNDEQAFPRLFRDTWTVEAPNLYVTVSGSYDGARSIGTMRFTAFERRGRGAHWQRTDLTIRERNWRHAQVEAALHDAGLQILRVRRVQPYPPEQVDAPRNLWIARKK